MQNDLRLIRTVYRSCLMGTGKLWCESSNPEEVIMQSLGRQVYFEKHETYEVTSGWGKWDGKIS